ncbi:MAG: HNH endonuclease, partial [Saezia sp.]
FNILKYRVVANANNSVLLPVEKRTIQIPRREKGGIGQSNVWYADSPEIAELRADIESFIENAFSQPSPDVDLAASAIEGAQRLRMHLKKERNKALVDKKKQAILKEKGRLSCEVCEFDFAWFYGVIGEDFCEVHHLKPLSEAKTEVETSLSDLAIVCSNCHRILHKPEKMFTIEKLSQIVKIQRSLANKTAPISEHKSC